MAVLRHHWCSLISHRMHRDVGDLGQSFSVPGESLGRFGVVASVVPDCFLGVRPGMSRLAVGHESEGDSVTVVCLHQRSTFEAFDLQGLLPLTSRATSHELCSESQEQRKCCLRHFLRPCRSRSYQRHPTARPIGGGDPKGNHAVPTGTSQTHSVESSLGRGPGCDRFRGARSFKSIRWATKE
jgi:hypothetical protein